MADTTRVKLLNIYASPRGCFAPGDVLDLPRHEAAELIAGRYAELVGPAPAPAPVAQAVAAPETAAVAQPEATTRRRSRNPLSALKR